MDDSSLFSVVLKELGPLGSRKLSLETQFSLNLSHFGRTSSGKRFLSLVASQPLVNVWLVYTLSTRPIPLSLGKPESLVAAVKLTLIWGRTETLVAYSLFRKQEEN